MSGCFGRAEAMGHAGELLQGALRVRGVAEPFLITLPAATLRSEATVEANAVWHVEPAWKTKALDAARIAAMAWGWTGRAAIRIRSAIPAGRGYGSSTADCVAAIRALAAMLGVEVSAEDIAVIAARAELACDSTMFGLRPVAFLPLRGRCERYFDGAWPDGWSVEMVDLGGPGVDTCATPRPRYTAREIEEFEVLLRESGTAFARRDASALGAITTRSAAIHQRYRPHPAWARLRDRAMARGALGVAIAHSGTAAAILTVRRPAVPCR